MACLQYLMCSFILAELILLLRYMTGSKTIPKKILVSFQNGSMGVGGATCAMRLTLPVLGTDYDFDTFSAIIRAVLPRGKKSFTVI